MIIKIRKMFPDVKEPIRTSDGAVGYDVHAYRILDKFTKGVIGELPVTIEPHKSVLIGIGLQLAVPPGIDCQLRPRSGLATKHDIELGNSPGTLDPDFRGEAGVYLRNHGEAPFTIKKGDRIVQLVFTKVLLPEFVEVDTLPITVRNTGGFGATGLNGPGFGTDAYRAEVARWDKYFMGIAVSASSLSDCLRGVIKENGVYPVYEDGSYVGATRKFGCVITKDNIIIAQGYNTRTIECSEAIGCVRENECIASGIANDRGCLHAEEVAIQNHALSGGPSLRGTTIYVNAEPCVKCAKFLMGCGIEAIVVPLGTFPTNGLKILSDAGVEIRYIKTQSV
ncbi:MAG: hypothetical protein A3C84_02325 [Candidatus Ryanbacteria bacterium RIFCSPHIGHO2_02_FULL_48_12]|uniref:dUTP diphosphatase n=1 Tax=Candidatus Ryanbacteria bacterium RIFCSPHIGHO2_01_FULL_48_27 TaxID=1802115 RepID=A0A1G2G602_9BACT|nr:MAG: hypothetical protein A2756_01770 [Candidatus Ryanbacteria bacterium RIFCSPHIGHO2_01_FULL_48_27]OGZ48887.1 MAG: hypothetical protein A3C84_02325 [Candidatus Ryanbacteria bacterium RIFCSPHIGHO2_02_FULL_48_12]